MLIKRSPTTNLTIWEILIWNSFSNDSCSLVTGGEDVRSCSTGWYPTPRDFVDAPSSVWQDGSSSSGYEHDEHDGGLVYGSIIPKSRTKPAHCSRSRRQLSIYAAGSRMQKKKPQTKSNPSLFPSLTIARNARKGRKPTTRHLQF